MNATNSGVSLEVVAAVTAVVAAVLDRPLGSFVVTRIQPEERLSSAHSPAPVFTGAWGKAGLLESHLLRRQFGLRNR